MVPDMLSEQKHLVIFILGNYYTTTHVYATYKTTDLINGNLTNNHNYILGCVQSRSTYINKLHRKYMIFYDYKI